MLARLSLLEGDLEKAEEQALRVNDLSGQKQSFDLMTGIVHTTLAAIPRLRGDPNEAARRLAQIAATAHAAGRASGFLEEAARAALALGRPMDAADLLATASAIRSVRNRPVVPIERADLESLARALIPFHGRVLDNEAAVRTIVSLSGTELTRESSIVPR